MEIAPAEGHELEFSVMFDRIGTPARGRDGCGAGAPGFVTLDDGTKLRAKGWLHVPAGRRLVLELPGGGGFGDPAERPPGARDAGFVKGYVTRRKT